MNRGQIGKASDPRHYSYALYEKDDVTYGFDAARFKGEIGRYIAGHQESFLLEQIGNPEGRKILDVGAGTGRTSLPLGSRGAIVTAADASAKMLGILKEKGFLQGIPIHVSRIDAHYLPFSDKSYDVVLSLRMIMHVVDWQRALAELCRVASRLVIVDFPPKCGFAGLAPLVHPIIRPFNANHQSYKVFSIKRVASAFAAEGFEVAAIDRHMVLPFGLHRFINSPTLTQWFENRLKKAGLCDLLGAPVTLVARRKDTAI